MAEYDLSRITDVNGNNWNIKAKALESQVKLAISGDAAGSVTTDLSTDATISISLADNSVDSAEIKSGAVGTDELAANAVTYGKLSSALVADSVLSTDTQKVPTSAAVASAIATAIAAEGKYLGQHTVAEINAYTAENLHNADRVMCTDSGTITLGNLSVRAGEDLIFYKPTSGDAVWQAMDGEFKLTQAAVSDPTAEGTTLTVIDTISQNTNGEITATKKTIQDGTTSQKGVVKLSSTASATEESLAATPKGVANAINALDAEITSNTSGANVQVMVTETNGKVSGVSITTDNTENKNNKVSSWSATTTDTHYPSEKLVKDSLDNKLDDSQLVTSWSSTTSDTNIPSEKLVKEALDGKQASGDYKTTQTAKSDSGWAIGDAGITFVNGISQDTNGVITATKASVRMATENQTGVVQVGTGLSVSSGTVSVSYGTTAGTACQGNDSRLSDSRTPTSHTHGNITNDGKLQTTDVTIASGDKLVVTDASDSNKIARTSAAFDGTTETQALTKKGTFASFEAPFTITYNGTNHSLTFSKAFVTDSST